MNFLLIKWKEKRNSYLEEYAAERSPKLGKEDTQKLLPFLNQQIQYLSSLDAALNDRDIEKFVNASLDTAEANKVVRRYSQDRLRRFSVNN